ncbi:MAG TPA: hypothetical protein PKA63_00800 [Oligoflexia bacterium]|nr:hypothetical protein [Oligoflexia bacterium]HMP47188.1 hypothetical protein [Oligoflexia bacterium]
MPFKFDKFLSVFWGTVLVVVLLGRTHYTFNKITPHQNALCIGQCFLGLKNRSDLIQTKWNLTPNLSLKTREDILKLRTMRVSENKDLIAGKYQPSRFIYGSIEDGLRWWGFDGYYQHLRSPDLAKWSVAGPSLRGEEIFNPFYLVTFKPLTYTVENSDFEWNPKISPAVTGSPCPFWPRKSDVLWSPAENKAEVVYFMSEYINLLKKNSCLKNLINTQKIDMGLDPVNAQDFGFSFIGFSETDSMNITFSELESKLIELKFYYHRGTSCRTPEGCNNISPLVKDLFGAIKTQELPARLNLNLWIEKPENIESTPDFRYIIHLR